MREPRAHPTRQPDAEKQAHTSRAPRAFDAPEIDAPIADLTDAPLSADPLVAPGRPKGGWMRRVSLTAASILVSLSLWLAADALVRDLFARQPWLGWIGLAAAVLFALGLVLFVVKEVRSIWRLSRLDKVRAEAATARNEDRPHGGDAVRDHLLGLYANRPDLARARATLAADWETTTDGVGQLALLETDLMHPLDRRARALIAGAARRVAVVTAISPRALVDLAYVAYESLKLARTIATLYGARPGFFGSWRLAGTILSHLAITGGVALGDAVVQQILGQGLAARLSARLGEGLVNGLMTVRVGIAAMRVTRPLPFEALPQPQVMEFMTDLAKITRERPNEDARDRGDE